MINGMQYLPNYISWQEHNELLSTVDKQVWLCELKRRVQHYGYRYDYKMRSTNQTSALLGPLPEWVEFLMQKLVNDKIVNEKPNQLIVNEYQPGQGIAEHIDAVTCFGATILSLSLGSACLMNFKNSATLAKATLLLEPCSLLVLQGEARYKWKHSIAVRKNDQYQAQTIKRQRRVSLTFRTVL